MLIFAVLGVMAHRALIEGFSDFGKGDGEVSEVSEVQNEEESKPDNKEEEEGDGTGDIFTAVVLCVDEENTVVNCAFIDANEKTGKYICCEIPPSSKVPSEFGNPVPVAYLFGTMSPDEICKYVTAMTGIETDYCFRFQKDDMSTIAGIMAGPSVKLPSTVRIPLFDEEEESKKEETEDGEESGDVSGDVSGDEGVDKVPPVDEEDLYLVIENDDDGKVKLNAPNRDNKSNLVWLLESEKEESGNRRNVLYKLISGELFHYFFVDQGSTKKVSVLTKLMSISDNNFNNNAANEHLETIFATARFDYHDYTYSNWNTSVEDLRRLDGRFDKSWYYDSLE